VFLRYLRTLYPPGVRLGIVLDNFSPHLSTRTDRRVAGWAAANNVELAYVPTNASWLNRIEAQFQALRYFTLDGTDHTSHQQQASMIRRYIAWRNQHAHHQRLREIVDRANVA
jgi:DDE superfamily endonuclease